MSLLLIPINVSLNSDFPSQNFSVCSKCSRLTQLYHRLHHQKRKMFDFALEVVEERRKSAANSDTTKILNELLANEVWLEQVRKVAP